MTFSPASFQFEVSVTSNVDVKSNVFLNGQIIEVKDPIFSIPEISEIGENKEEVLESEVYSKFAYYGCHLGPQFQLIKKIIIGKEGKILLSFLLFWKKCIYFSKK